MASGGMDIREPIIDFSLYLFKQIARDQPQENAFLSPCSVHLVMAMLQLGAEGNTLEQMSKTLKLEMESQGVQASMQNFLKLMKTEDKNFSLNIANRLYPHVDKTILEEYIKRVKDIFLADTESLDFTKDPEGSRVLVNQWVEKETREKIKDILAPGIITPLTAMVVVNAIYFKGDWADKFDKERIMTDDFFVTKDKKFPVDMMTKRFKKIHFGYSKDLSCKTLELPYKGALLSMIIILPDNIDGLPTLESKLNSKTLKSLLSNVHQSTVDVSLPKFKLESNYAIHKILPKLGMTDLFNVSKANLSGMCKSEELFVSHVVHKAFVQVDEEGTEAAAATAAVVMKRSIVMAESFSADHPFLFLIWDVRVKAPLFMGRYVLPDTGVVSQRAHDEF